MEIERADDFIDNCRDELYRITAEYATALRLAQEEENKWMTRMVAISWLPEVKDVKISRIRNFYDRMSQYPDIENLRSWMRGVEDETEE